MMLPVLLCILLSCCYSVPVEEVVKAEVAPDLGGWHTLPLNSKKLVTLTKLLENTYNEKNYSLYWFKIKQVLEAYYQVVNGINYQISVIIEPTGCLKEEDLKTCISPGLDGMKVEICHYYIKENLPKLKPEIISKTCEDV